jgi:hypothetical protein
MPLSHVLGSLVSWLKAGYPYGVPDRDYLPLLSLLARRLTNEEVAAVAAELQRSGDQVESADIATLIEQVTNEPPRNEDVARVRAQLTRGGPFL